MPKKKPRRKPPSEPTQPLPPNHRVVGEREILADLSQQAPHHSTIGRPVYRDLAFTCIDCGQEEVWTAEQQRWWYEVAKGSIYTTAIRCRACRQQA